MAFSDMAGKGKPSKPFVHLLSGEKNPCDLQSVKLGANNILRVYKDRREVDKEYHFKILKEWLGR